MANATDASSIQATLAALFPSAAITPEIVAAVQAAMLAPPAAPAAGASDAYRYYMAEAAHSRTLGTTSRFVGNLPLIRFALPATGDFGADLVPTLETAIGFVIPEDRLIASVAMVADLTGKSPARVDLLTPARAPGPKGARFGAFATYLCYDDAGDAVPAWYVLEAGTAPGQPKVLFQSDGMTPIVNKPLGYEPTPFSKATDEVSGLLKMNADEPRSLQITVTDTSGVGPDADASKPYVSVLVDYVALPLPPDNHPISLILEAAARIGVIGHALHVNPGIAETLAALIEGASLQWITKPG